MPGRSHRLGHVRERSQPVAKASLNADFRRCLSCLGIRSVVTGGFHWSRFLRRMRESNRGHPTRGSAKPPRLAWRFPIYGALFVARTRDVVGSRPRFGEERNGFTTMKRLFFVGLAAIPLLLAATSPASAQCDGPGCGFGGHGRGGGNLSLGPGAAPTNAFWGAKHIAGCGAFAFRFLGPIHQHGPLFNYGPYSGYYPFEPYGMWSSDLKYHGPWYYPVDHGYGGLFGRHGGGCDACGHGWKGYARHVFHNVFHRLHPGAHKCGITSCLGGHCSGGAGTCSSCGGMQTLSEPTAPTTSTQSGNSMSAQSSSSIPGELQLTSYPRRERGQ